MYTELPPPDRATIRWSFAFQVWFRQRSRAKRRAFISGVRQLIAAETKALETGNRKKVLRLARPEETQGLVDEIVREELAWWSAFADALEAADDSRKA